MSEVAVAPAIPQAASGALDPAPRARIPPGRGGETGAPGLARALTEWRSLLGPDGVRLEDQARQSHGANMLNLHRTIPAVLFPRDAAQIQALMRVAARQQVALYPVSTGRNWGYGSALPVRDGQVLVDCSRMNRILDFDPGTGVVGVEPGVTQERLAAFLNEQGYEFLVPVTGAGPQASLLGNALERGWGITPRSDHFGALTALEAVLPDGSLYRSAMAEAGGREVGQAFKWGLGPYLDGLFAQGNLGIVTRGSIALAARPARVEGFLCALRPETNLEEICAATQRVLHDAGMVMGDINLMNARRMLSMVEPYPEAYRGSGAALPESWVRQAAPRHRITPWTLFGALYGTPGLVAAGRKELKRRLRPLARQLVFLNPRTTNRLSRFCAQVGFLRDRGFARFLGRLDASLQLLAGRPSDIALPLAYYKTRHDPLRQPSLNPAADGSGLTWYAPLVPMRGERVRVFVDLVERSCVRHGMEPLITLTSHGPGCWVSTVPLLFDRADAAEQARAYACFDELFRLGQVEGFLPYRLSIREMDRIADGSAPCWQMVRRIKAAIDPQGLIAPGRYGG